jgi:hypothetical protein
MSVSTPILIGAFACAVRAPNTAAAPPIMTARRFNASTLHSF